MKEKTGQYELNLLRPTSNFTMRDSTVNGGDDNVCSKPTMCLHLSRKIDPYFSSILALFFTG